MRNTVVANIRAGVFDNTFHITEANLDHLTLEGEDPPILFNLELITGARYAAEQANKILARVKPGDVKTIDKIIAVFCELSMRLPETLRVLATATVHEDEIDGSYQHRQPSDDEDKLHNLSSAIMINSLSGIYDIRQPDYLLQGHGYDHLAIKVAQALMKDRASFIRGWAASNYKVAALICFLQCIDTRQEAWRSLSKEQAQWLHRRIRDRHARPLTDAVAILANSKPTCGTLDEPLQSLARCVIRGDSTHAHD